MENKCKRCGKAKRKNKRDLCILCWNRKNFNINPALTETDIFMYKKLITDFKHRLEVKQHGYIDLHDINMILEYYQQIVGNDYIGASMLKFGQQISLMWKYLNLFLVTNFKYKKNKENPIDPPPPPEVS